MIKAVERAKRDFNVLALNKLLDYSFFVHTGIIMATFNLANYYAVN